MSHCQHRDEGTSREVTVVGAADIASCAALQEELAGLVVPGKDMTLILDQVTSLDGAGLQLVIAFRAFVEQSGGALQITAEADVPRRAIEMAGAVFAPNPRDER